MQLTIYVDPRFDFNKRKAIGTKIINYIKLRTKKGKGFNNNKFTNTQGQARYSEAYIKSKEFKSAGKNPSPINIDLTGNTLDALKIKDATLAGRIIIGFSNETASKKSDYMRDKGYDFMSLSSKEQEELLSEFTI